MLGPHKLVQVLWEHTNQVVCESIKDFDLVRVTLDVDIVVKRRRHEVHRDAPIERAEDSSDLTSLSVEGSDLKDIVLEPSMLCEEHVVVLVDIEVELLLSLDASVLHNLLL